MSSKTLKKKVFIAPATPSHKNSFDNRNFQVRMLPEENEGKEIRGNLIQPGNNPLNMKFKDRLLRQNRLAYHENCRIMNSGMLFIL